MAIATAEKIMVYVKYCAGLISAMVYIRNAIAPPTPPMRLIIAFACDLNGFGVTSGINATAGDLNDAMAISTIKSIIIYALSIILLFLSCCTPFHICSDIYTFIPDSTYFL